MTKTETHVRKDKRFSIGDRIVVKNWDDISEERRSPTESCNDNPLLWSRSKARICGQHGEVVDMVYSYAHKCELYRIRLDGAEKISASMLPAQDLEHEEETHYTFEFDFGEDSCTALMKDGDRVVAKGTSIKFGTDKFHMANAASIALKNLFFCVKAEHDDLVDKEWKK